MTRFHEFILRCISVTSPIQNRSGLHALNNHQLSNSTLLTHYLVGNTAMHARTVTSIDSANAVPGMLATKVTEMNSSSGPDPTNGCSNLKYVSRESIRHQRPLVPYIRRKQVRETDVRPYYVRNVRHGVAVDIIVRENGILPAGAAVEHGRCQRWAIIDDLTPYGICDMVQRWP